MTAAVTSGGASLSGTGKSVLSNVADQKDMFLKLLVAQLQNQDPTAPMDQKDMMAQMAQFTSVEQMTEMVKSLDALTTNTMVSQSVGLIGHDVDYVVESSDGSSASIESSTVTSVAINDGKVTMMLANGSEITPAEIVRVTS